MIETLKCGLFGHDYSPMWKEHPTEDDLLYSECRRCEQWRIRKRG